MVDEERKSGWIGSCLSYVVHAQAALAVDNGVAELTHIGQELIELRSRDACRTILCGRIDKSPDLFDRATSEGRDSQVICPFCHTHATFDRLHHLFARMVVGQKIPFVEQDNDGAAALDGEIGDLLVLLGHTGGRVDNEQGDIGTVDCAKSANHRVVFDILVHSALFTNASSVYKAILLVSALDDGINGIARGAGDVGHNGTIGTKNLVEQGGLAGIGPTDDGDGENAVIDLFFLI